MSELKNNTTNILYFESSSMSGLYDFLEKWQNTSQKRILSLNIQQDHKNFCCIVLTSPQSPTQPSLTPYEVEMAKFQRKALKHIGVGVAFLSDAIKPEKILAIQEKVKNCKTAAEVKIVFLEAHSAE